MDYIIIKKTYGGKHMKKRITIVLGILFVLMFSAVCVAEEEGCGDHTRNCDESVCFSCGVAYTGDSVRHDESYYEYSSNATYHWHECNACGKKTYDELHYAVCSDPKVCCCCGQPFTGT